MLEIFDIAYEQMMHEDGTPSTAVQIRITHSRGTVINMVLILNEQGGVIDQILIDHNSRQTHETLTIQHDFGHFGMQPIRLMVQSSLGEIISSDLIPVRVEGRTVYLPLVVR